MTPDLTIILTDAQTAELLPLVRQQPVTKRGLLLISVAPFFDDEGTTRLRLQAVFVRQSAASKILKIIEHDGNREQT
jgi:hypothetical protein